jgi:thiol:disulfide interchange protein DsbD
VDDKTRLPQVIEVEENGRITRLKTVGDKWSYLQRHKFGANAQPYYIALDNEGKPVSPPYAYDENVEKYIEFLQTGLRNYRKKQSNRHNNQTDITTGHNLRTDVIIKTI